MLHKKKKKIIIEYSLNKITIDIIEKKIYEIRNQDFFF